MKISIRQHRDQPQRLRPAIGLSPLALACSVLLVPPAQAQQTAAPDAATKTTETVVVTGIRGSIESSIATKRNADSIVEAVTAEDIGKLPDVSIAESLARLPGVAAQRVDGRAQVLSIRGMAPKFGVTLLNGREMVSTGDDRSFEYDQFPSELVNSAVLYKTPDAALGTQGLSGTVDLHTVRPLDYAARKVSLNVRIEKNSLGDIVPGSKSAGARFSASYIDQFADRTIGVALGFARLDSPNQKKYFNPWDYGTADWLTNCCGTVDGLLAGTSAYDGAEMGAASTQTVRDGLMAVLEYKPSKDLHSQVDLFSSKFSQRMNGREFIAYWNDWANGTTPNWSPLANSHGGGVIANITPFMTMRKDNRNDYVDAAGWNTVLKAGGWTTTGDLSWSRATRHESIGEAYATGIDPATFNVVFPAGLSGFGSVTSAFGFANPANWQLSGAWWGGGAVVGRADVNDEAKSLRLQTRRDVEWGPVSGFDGGVIYAERSKNLGYVQTSYNLTQGTDCNMWPSCAPIPAGLLQSPVNLGFLGVGPSISFDVFNATNSAAYTVTPSDPKSPSWNWGVSEKITTAFAKVNLDFHAGMPVRGNVGVQIVNARQTASGLYDDNQGNLTPVTGGRNYTDVLPSLNLVGELGPSALLRLGVARTVARPNMADMRAGTTASVSQTDRTWSGSGGNPQLEPWRANAFDLSLEKYFGKRSYVAFAVWDKQVTTGILTKDVAYDFTGFTNPSGIQPISNLGTMTTPTNTHGGRIHGIELSAALAGELVSRGLDGFGVIASYSDTTSNLPGTDASGAATNTSLEGLSGHVWGLTGYYEKNGFQFRIAQRYRSTFYATRHNAFKFIMDSIQAEKITDLQIGYEFQGGLLKGLGLLFQVNNLTNTPYVTTATANGSTWMNGYQQFGRQYLLGLNYGY
ncbi:MAG: TonB-dependent receptor [Burkholderiales bacterium]|nr:TonB-dependent receptor [Burkholderiales bacterium]